MIDYSFNKNFKLNGKSFTSVDDVVSYSKTISFSVSIFLEGWFNDSQVINVQTSGSTGKPKLIGLQKAHMINSAKATGAFFDLPEKTTALLCLSADYIAGKMMLVRAIVLGWHVDIVDASSNPLHDIETTYDFCAMVPMQVQNSLTNLNKVKKLIVGGGAVKNDLFDKLQSVSTEIFATYGMTETITHIAIKRLNRVGCSKMIIIANYKTLENVTVSRDSRGCLIIDAPKISDERINTNDLVEIISNNEFKWLGRIDNVVNSGGVKLVPELIEERLAKIINQRFFVAGIPDEFLGEKLVLLVESIDTDFTLNQIEQSIISLNTLKKFEIPKKIFLMEKFVETETKKINRKATLLGLEDLY